MDHSVPKETKATIPISMTSVSSMKGRRLRAQVKTYL
jgi:hypothetical protein